MKFEPGDWIRGPYWQGAAQIISVQPRPSHELVTIRVSNHSQTYVFIDEDWQLISRDMPTPQRLPLAAL